MASHQFFNVPVDVLTYIILLPHRSDPSGFFNSIIHLLIAPTSGELHDVDKDERFCMSLAGMYVGGRKN